MTSNSTLLQLDLKVILQSLCSSIQDVMSSWYNVQETAFALSPQPILLRSSLAPVREHLQVHWECIRSHLQKSHDFGEDVALWQKSFEGPRVDRLSVLEELTASATELVEGSQALMQQSTKGLDLLSCVSPQLSVLRRAPKSSADVSETDAFLGVSRATDGLGATFKALTEIHNNLHLTHQFWTVASETCSTLSDSREDQMHYIGQVRKEWQQDIQHAITSIVKSLDAVVVEPPLPLPLHRPMRTATKLPATPTSRRVPRRRRSFKSADASLPDSFIFPARKSMDDEVPKSCWSFGFGDWKRK